VFDLLELGGDDLRGLPWTKRTELLREAFPTGDRLRLITAQPASRAAHDQLIALGFEGSVLKRPGSTYRPGLQTTWRKSKASHRAIVTLKALRKGRDGNTYAISDLAGWASRDYAGEPEARRAGRAPDRSRLLPYRCRRFITRGPNQRG
jgi:ATP-dependent DNA ligase